MPRVFSDPCPIVIIYLQFGVDSPATHAWGGSTKPTPLPGNLKLQGYHIPNIPNSEPSQQLKSAHENLPVG